MENAIYGVAGMMCVILVITFALVRAPRRKHAWESGRRPNEPGASKASAPTLRAGRWRLREQTIEAVGQSSMVSYGKTEGARTRLAIRNVGPNLEGAALVLDRSLVDPELAKLLEDGASPWKGEIDHQAVEITAPIASDETDVASFRGWLERQELGRPIGEIVMISLPAIDYRVPFERPLLRTYRDAALARTKDLDDVIAANAEEREWVKRAEEMKSTAARAATADDDTLRSIEQYAKDADALADQRDDAQAQIEAGVKRRFLLVQMAAFSLLDPNESKLAESLERRGFSLLADVHRGACALSAYLTSEARKTIVGVSAPASPMVAVLAAPFSLDLFRPRRGALLVPSALSPTQMLAKAEAETVWDAPTKSPIRFVKSGGFRYELHFRHEDGIRFVLSRASITEV
jgi:hypothetical protein